MTDGIAMIRFRCDGKEHTWAVGCDLDQDTEDTMRAKLARWVPDAEWLSVEFRPGRKR